MGITEFQRAIPDSRLRWYQYSLRSLFVLTLVVGLVSAWVASRLRPPRRPMDVLSVAFSPDGKTLASADGYNAFRLWDVASGKNTATLKGHADCVQSVAFSPDAARLVSGGRDAIMLWNVKTGRLERQYWNRSFH
jgi:WD40 repeat protein